MVPVGYWVLLIDKGLSLISEAAVLMSNRLRRKRWSGCFDVKKRLFIGHIHLFHTKVRENLGGGLVFSSQSFDKKRLFLGRNR